MDDYDPKNQNLSRFIVLTMTGLAVWGLSVMGIATLA